MMEIISGKALKYGHGINTDVIIPGKYLVYTDPLELAKHAMEGMDPDFIHKLASRNILVAGRNFGCGSSREQAPIALKYAGVKCILAHSFARIFYRNPDGDFIRINFEKGLIEDVTQNVKIQTNPVPSFLLQIMKKGLVEYLKEQGEKR
jgi:3-isopropylmalate dehydratase small subunit